MKIYFLILSLFLASTALPALAVEPGADRPGVVGPEAAQENMFGLTRIDFFNENPVNDTNIPNSAEESWTEPVISPNGQMTYYKPPEQVKEFLDNPSLETGEKYLDWNLNRINKLAMAQDVLNILVQKKRLKTDHSNQGQNIDPIPSSLKQRWQKSKNYIAFFLIKGCPYCEEEKKVILDLQKSYPQTIIDVFVKGYSPLEIKGLPFKAREENDLAKALGFSKYPTTFIIPKSGKGMLIPGLVSKEYIEQLLQ